MSEPEPPPYQPNPSFGYEPSQPQTGFAQPGYPQPQGYGQVGFGAQPAGYSAPYPPATGSQWQQPNIPLVPIQHPHSSNEAYGGEPNKAQYGGAPPRPPVPTYTSPEPIPPTNYSQPNSGDAEAGGDFLSRDFSNKIIRHAFIRKVYFTLTCQLLVTFGIVALFVFCDPVREFAHANPLLYYFGYALFMVTYLMLVCCKNVRRKFPHNLLMLGIFTLSLSYMVGMISSFYSTKIVFMAIGITAGITGSVTVFACQTKFDFTKWIGILFVASMGFFFFGIMTIFFYSEIMYVVYSAIGAVLFTVFLAVDTQLIIGGKRHEISPEDHVLGAIMLYIDIVYIFLFILSLLGYGDRN